MIPWADYADAVRRLRGATFTHMGRSAATGVDCVGVPYAAAAAVGLELGPTLVYDAMPTQEQLEAGLAAFCDRVEDVGRAHIWQVPLFGGARHVMVPLEDDGDVTVCVHAFSRRNRVQESLWRREVAQGWTIRGIEWRPQA
jgi:hypothetical protein